MGSQEMPAESWLEEGMDYYSKGKYREAADCFIQIAGQNFTPEQQRGLGEKYYAVGRDAENKYEQDERENLGVIAAKRAEADEYYKKAEYWYRAAADQGYAPAMISLGVMYEGYYRRNSAPAMAHTAEYWYRAAANQGDKGAMYYLDALRLQIEEDDIYKEQQFFEAESFARGCADKCVGDRFDFGTYPQGENGEYKSITWLVLKRAKTYLLVMSEQCLDCQPYHKDNKSIAWADCTLRRWLNAEFRNKAFNEFERKLVLDIPVFNDGGENTEDSVFLLSLQEVNDLVGPEVRRARATDYAAAKGVQRCDDNRCCWWLRSSDGDKADIVDFDGNNDTCPVNGPDTAVRPVLRININS